MICRAKNTLKSRVFERRILAYYERPLCPYPEFRIREAARIFASTLRRSLAHIRAKAAAKFGDIYRFVLRRLPIDEEVDSGGFEKFLVFEGLGDFIDKSLRSNFGDARPGDRFYGRPIAARRFNPGEIVEWLADSSVRQGVVVYAPPTPREQERIMERAGASDKFWKRGKASSWTRATIHTSLSTWRTTLTAASMFTRFMYSRRLLRSQIAKNAVWKNVMRRIKTKSIKLARALVAYKTNKFIEN